MNHSSITLELDKVFERISTFARNEIDFIALDNIKPSSNLVQIKTSLEEVDEALRCIYSLGYIPSYGAYDISKIIKRANIGSILGINELIIVAKFSNFIKELLMYKSNAEKEDFIFSYLNNYFDGLINVNHISKSIFNCIDESGLLYDTASDKLYGIRKSIRSLESKIKEKLNQILQSRQSYLTESLITIRNNRYVVPVKVEYKNTFKGVIHDQSASGSTVFIEPQAVNELNTKMNSMMNEEKIEIERILAELSVIVGDSYEELKSNFEIVTRLFEVFLKAKFAKEYNCTKPNINAEGLINLKKARHPLINQDEVVANDVVLGYDFDTIVITGPNTGGKTVTLKTVGLLALMVKCGMLIPVKEHSEMAIFDNIYVDIGDEQSIEQNLSTFSSHMNNIINIISNVDDTSLVLLDELGAGTDPKEGSALAMAIIDFIRDRGSKLIATTHYADLKLYAYEKIRTINASVEFDINSFAPTYKLLIGVPGQSNALKISKRLGLIDEIIDNAAHYDERSNTKVSTLIKELEIKSIDLSKKLNNVNELEIGLEEKMDKYNSLIDDSQEKAERIINEAYEKANDVYKNAQKEVDDVVSELRKMLKHSKSNVKEHEITELKSTLKKRYSKANDYVEDRDLDVGDEVFVINLQRSGELIEKIGNNEWIVKIGVLTSRVKKNNLKLIRKKNEQNNNKARRVKSSGVSKSSVKIKLDLRGERYEDALIRLDKYISDVLISGYENVTIVHGHGTGAIRKAVQEYLKKSPYVKSFRYGREGEGGNGATVVQLK